MCPGSLNFNYFWEKVHIFTFSTVHTRQKAQKEDPIRLSIFLWQEGSQKQTFIFCEREMRKNDEIYCFIKMAFSKEMISIRYFIFKSIFDKCSMLEQTQSRPNHTSKTKVYVNEFVANVLRDNIGSKTISLQPQKKNEDDF